MDNGAARIEFGLSAPDLVFLTGLYGGSHLFGVPDPFKGKSDSEIRAAMEEVSSSLEERGVISINDGAVTLADPDLEVAIAALAWPDCTIVVSVNKNDRISSKFFHASKYFSVWHAAHEDGQEIVLNLSRSITQTALEIISSLELPGSDVITEGEAFSCTAEELSSMLEGQRLDVPSSSEKAFSEFLQGNPSIAVLSCFDRRGGYGKSSGIVFLCNDKGLWEITPGSSPAASDVIVKPSGSISAKSSVRRIVWGFLPELAMRMF